MRQVESGRINTMPLVSICIPTYNSEKYLELMLDSIVAQSYKNLEVIISDNSSSDSSVEIAKAYANKYGWHLFSNDINLGAAGNFNKLIGLASGEYVAIYHSDDIYHPNIVEKSCNVLNSNPNVGIVSSCGTEINGKGDKIREINIPKEMLKVSDGLYDFEIVFNNILAQNCFFLITPSVMVRSEAYKKLGLFNMKYASASDYEMWFRIMQKFRLYIINEELIEYRSHDGQGSNLEIWKNLNKPDSLLVYEEYANINPQLFLNNFMFSYYKLMYILALKFNNRGEFLRSNKVLDDIKNKIGKKNLSLRVLYLMNALKGKVSLQVLLRLKHTIKLFF